MRRRVAAPSTIGAVLLAAAAASTNAAPLPRGLDEFALVPSHAAADDGRRAARVELGRHLFFDGRLSKSGDVSCATCHVPAKGWSNALRFGVGVEGKTGDRNVPSILNRAFGSEQFWDGRAGSLEAQASQPMVNPLEMGHTTEGVVARIAAVRGYRPLFRAAFGSAKVTLDRISSAIAEFERTIFSGDSPYDRWSEGDPTAMSPAAIRGEKVFRDPVKGRCGVCHAGFNFTDERYHNIGVGADVAGWENTSSRGREAVSKAEKDRGAWKTPSLRQLVDTGPYMHDGSEATLEAVVDYYARGGNPNPWLDKEMKALPLSADEKADLVEFLKALSGHATNVEPPTPVR